MAVSTRRLAPSDGPLSLRQQLALFAKQLGPGLGPIAERIQTADHILLMDVQPFSRLWHRRNDYWRDDVVVVDGVTACLHFTLSLLLRAREKLPQLLRLTRAAAAVYLSEPANAWRKACAVIFYGAVTSAYADLINQSDAKQAVFFTSNSRLAETLRAYLIQSEEVNDIVELMHGVGSLQAEAMFTEHLSFGYQLHSSHKHTFVPQIPEIPLRGMFLHCRAATPRAVNAYLNRYFVELGQRGRSPVSMMRLHAQTLLSGCASARPTIVVVFGYPAYEGDFETPAFRAETFLIDRIASLASALGKEISLAYVPHPLCQRTQRHEVFARHAVKTLDGPVPAWLLCDLCVSLQSSAMFEAAYFGVRSFTPMLESDGIFSPAYMQIVSHPEEGSLDALDASLRAWLQTREGTSHEERSERLSLRLGLMGWDANLLPQSTQPSR